MFDCITFILDFHLSDWDRPIISAASIDIGSIREVTVADIVVEV
jgi:hypothetical protein